MMNVKYGIQMLLRLKEKALEAESGDQDEFVLRTATGCGMFALASHIDDILKTLLEQQTELANYKYMYKLSHDVENQWNDLGFCENPEDMSEEQKAELKAIAGKFYSEDDDPC